MTATFALICALLAGCTVATPRSAPVQPAQSGAPQRGVGQLSRQTVIPRGVLQPVTSAAAAPASPESEDVRPLVPAPLTLAAGTWQGTINYAAPAHGRWYLAIPAGPGIRVRICGPAGCLERTSTDAGPNLAMQRAGRIADLNWLDWQAISGVPLRFGGFQGTVLVLSRVKLPETDTLEGY